MSESQIILTYQFQSQYHIVLINIGECDEEGVKFFSERISQSLILWTQKQTWPDFTDWRVGFLEGWEGS